MKNFAQRIVSVLIIPIILFSSASAVSGEAEFDLSSEAYASLESTTAISANMNVRIGNGSAPRVVERDGRYGWALGANEATASINCDLDRSFAYDISDGSIFEIEVDYYDADLGVFSLVYSAQDRPNRWAGMQMTEGYGAKAERNLDVKTWRTKTFYLYDAKFNDSFDGCDFKISSNILDSNHDITSSTDTGYGTKYSAFYPNRYGRISTVEDIVIGAVRVKKLTEKNPFAIKVTSENYGNIFFDDEEIKLNAELVNKFDKPYELDARYSIIDEYSNETQIGTDKVSVSAGETKNVTVSLKGVPYGCFKLRCAYTANGIRCEAVTEISRCREAKIPNEQIGTNIHLVGSDSYRNNDDATIQLARKAGYSSVRDSVQWFGNEKTAGVYEMRATTKKEIELCRKYGVDLLLAQEVSNTLYRENSEIPNRPEVLEAFKKYNTWLTKYLGDVSAAIETQNEYNLHFPTATAEDFVKLTKATYEGAKAGNPGIKVIGIDMALIDLGLMRRWFEAGVLEYMDGVSYHPYDWARSFEVGNQLSSAAAVRKLMEEFGYKDKEIWITETGWYQGLTNRVTNDDKAYNLARAIIQNAAMNVYDKIYFYEFVDSGLEPSYGESSYGTLNSVYSDVPYGAQPAYIAAANTNWLLGGTKFETTPNGPANLNTDAYAYRFKRSNTDGRGSHMIAVWTKLNSMEYGLDLGVDKATMIDFYGNEREIYAIDGRFSFCLTDRPMYLLGDFPKLEECEPPIRMSKISANATVNDAVSIDFTAPASAAANFKITPVNPLDFVAESNAGFTDGSARYTVDTPKLPFFNKSALFEIRDGEKLYYSGKLPIKNSDVLTVVERHELCDKKSLNRWKMTFEITNNKNVETVNANIDIRKPEMLTKYRSSIALPDLKPGETRSVVMFLPEIISKEMRDLDIVTTTDGGDVYRLNRKIFFTTVPYAHTKPKIDGIVSPGEYNSDAWFDIKAGPNKEHYQPLVEGQIHNGDNDLSGKATISYDEDNLYFFIEVTDDAFVNDKTGAQIWDGDGIQIGITDEETADNGAYCEIAVALTPEGSQVYRHMTNNSNNPTGAVENCEVQIVRDGSKTYYEIALPWSEVLTYPENVKPGYKPRFAFLINEDDGHGRNAYMEYSQVLGAIGTHKNVAFFSDMYLAEK